MVDPIPHENEYEETRDAEGAAASAAFRAFSTVVTLKVCAEEGVAALALHDALAACRRYERLFSRTLPNSDVSRINASRGALVEVDADTRRLLEMAKAYCAKSEGLFDITMGELVGLWSSAKDSPPGQDEIDAALERVDYRLLETHDLGSRCFARLANGGASLDLGGIAKGFIADELARILDSWAIRSYVIDLGGNVFARGRKPDGSRWMIGIRNPLDTAKVLGAFELENAAAVTSGTYERYRLFGGKAYHHILSPLTGYPVETDVRSVTVVSRRALDAEGFSTALLAMGLDRGCDFAGRQEGIMRAHFVTLENEVISVAGR